MLCSKQVLAVRGMHIGANRDAAWGGGHYAYGRDRTEYVTARDAGCTPWQHHRSTRLTVFSTTRNHKYMAPVNRLVFGFVPLSCLTSSVLPLQQCAVRQRLRGKVSHSDVDAPNRIFRSFGNGLGSTGATTPNQIVGSFGTLRTQATPSCGRLTRTVSPGFSGIQLYKSHSVFHRLGTSCGKMGAVLNRLTVTQCALVDNEMWMIAHLRKLNPRFRS